jgi:hypothetical protein
MKKGLLIIFATTLCLTVSAKSEYGYAKFFQSNAKSSYQPMIWLKYVSKNARTQDFSYSLKVPMNDNTLSFLTINKPRPRFVHSKTLLSSRSVNVSMDEVKFIVDKNKLYNLTGENFKIKTF